MYTLELGCRWTNDASGIMSVMHVMAVPCKQQDFRGLY